MEATWLKPTDKLVLGRLMKAAGSKGWCWPSQACLASWCGLSRKQVRLATANLLAARLIAVDVSKVGRSNGYHFRWHAVYEAEPSGTPQPVALQKGPTLAPQGTPLAPQGTPLAPQGASKRVRKRERNKERNKEQANLPFGPKPVASECGDCGGTGWREIESKGLPAVTRCGCIAKGA